MMLARRALALVLAFALAFSAGPMPASARMQYDTTGTNVLGVQRVASGPRSASLASATAANLLTSTTDLSVSPPWYNPVGVPTTLTGARLVVAPGDGRQTVVYQAIQSATPGHTYVVDMLYTKVAGSGAGVPRATFYKLGDSASTYPTAVVEQIGGGTLVHTFSTYTYPAGGTGELRANIELPAAVDNGCDITILSILVYDISSTAGLALPALNLPKAASVLVPSAPPTGPPGGVAATDADFAALEPINFPTDLPPADPSAAPAGGATLAPNATGENTNVYSVDFTPTGNVTTREALDAVTFSHMLTGTQNAGQASDYDTANPSFGASYALIGNYAKTSPLNNKTFGAKGLTLGFVNKPSNGKVVQFGQARSAFIRFEPVFHRGMFQEVCAILPKSRWGWMPPWNYGGRQQSWKRIAKALPGSVSGPYDQPIIDSEKRYLLDQTGSYIENDPPDAYYADNGFPGRVLTGGVVYKGPDAQTKVPPHRTFEANDNGFESYNGLASFPAGDEWWSKSHCYGIYLDDTKPYQVYTVDGRVYREEYNELYAPPLADALAPHAVEPSMFHLNIGGQGIAIFQRAPTGSGSLDNQGKPGVDLTGVDFADLGMTVQSVRMWKGKYTPASRGSNNVSTVFSPLTIATLPTAAGGFSTTIGGMTANSTVTIASSNPSDVCSIGSQQISNDNATYNVSTNALTCTISGTADRTFTLVEHPTSYARSNGTSYLFFDTGRTTTIPVSINPNGVLQALTLSNTTFPTDLPYLAKVIGRTPGSTLSGTSVQGGTTTNLSFNGDFAYAATAPSAEGAITITISETKSGATGLPKTTTLSGTVRANRVTTQDVAANVTGGATATNNTTSVTAPNGTQTAALVTMGPAGSGIAIPAGDSSSATFSAWIMTADASDQVIAHYNGATADFETFDGGTGARHFPKQAWVYVSDVQTWNQFRLYQQGVTTPNFYIWGLAVTAN